MIAAEPISHIRLDKRGVAWIDRTRVKVIEVVMDRLAHGSSPEEMHFQYPHLSLAQIHAALAYYYDHQKELDEQVARSCELAESMRARALNQPTRKELQARLRKQ